MTVSGWLKQQRKKGLAHTKMYTKLISSGVVGQRINPVREEMRVISQKKTITSD